MRLLGWVGLKSLVTIPSIEHLRQAFRVSQPLELVPQFCHSYLYLKIKCNEYFVSLNKHSNLTGDQSTISVFTSLGQVSNNFLGSHGFNRFVYNFIFCLK